MEENIILSMLVKNEVGVLTRVSGLFSRRGFNIGSLSVGETEDGKISRITIVTKGDEYIKEQITKQLEKLHDVIIVDALEEPNIVMRELVLIKVHVESGKRSELLEAASIFRAKVIDLTPSYLTLEITGDKSKCDAFVEYLKSYEIVELVRTGASAIQRGCAKLKDKPESQSDDGD